MAKTEARAKKKPTTTDGSLRIRMTDEYREWLDRAADHCQTNASGLVALAVAQYVNSMGFGERPPRRLS